MFYNENVYRVSESSGAFREIMQVGLECMGEIDDYQIYEVLLLAAKSLALISSEYVLDISHLGVISGLLDDLGLTGNERQTALKCVGEKNAHGLQQLLDEKNCGQKADAELLLELVKTSGKPAEMWRKLDGKLGKSRQNEWNLLRKLCEELDKAGVGEHLRLDFSVVNDMNYYNGIVFKGFVQSLPSGILSGGQYDKLMTKMHKSCGGIGFAVYLDQLAWMEHDRDPYDVDTVLLYSERTPLSALSARVAELTGQGERVLTRKTQPENLRCRRVCSMEEKEDMSVGTNA